MFLRALFRSLAVCTALLLGSVAHAATASFDANTGRLTLSSVKLSSNESFNNVVVAISNMGELKLDDASVGSDITFDLNTYTLRLPSVTVGGQTYNKVSLKGLTFSLVAVNGVTVDAGTSGGYNLDLVITASGIATPAVRIENVPKPSSQSEFCSDDVYKEFQQNVQGFSGSWKITSCSFNGTVGNISAQLTITSPYSISLPYSVTYTYSAR
jgi:hypothetical protein